MSGARCLICNTDIPHLGGLVTHFRLLHPDIFGDLERWPDGRLVIDESQMLEPADFQEDLP